MSWTGPAIAAFNIIYNNFNGDQVWECGPDEVDREKDLVFQRGHDNFHKEEKKY